MGSAFFGRETGAGCAGFSFAENISAQECEVRIGVFRLVRACCDSAVVAARFRCDGSFHARFDLNIKLCELSLPTHPRCVVHDRNPC